MKIAISFFGVLLLMVSGLLFFQYQVFSDKLETGEGNFSYSQEIEIVYRGESLDIRQHLSNLPNQTIEIKWPNLAVSANCFIESENSCKRLNDEKTKFEQGDIRSQSLSYIIPLDGGLKSRQLLKEIFVTLQNGEVTHSTVHITTDSGVNGQWVTGLPLVGQQSLSLVNYSMFSGTGPISELYWQAGDFKLQETLNHVAIYSKQPVTDNFKKQITELKLLNEHHIDLVHGGNITGEQGKRILFIKDLSIESIKQNVILAQVRSQYHFGNSPDWVSELVASYISGSVIGGSKTNEIVTTLTDQMTDEQLQRWVQKLNELKGEEISTKVLDEALYEVLGKYTQFLTLNEHTEVLFPFLYNDSRKVYVDSKPKEDVSVIFKDGFIYYSADTLLSHLSYEASEGNNGYYVNNATRHFRFPMEYDFYVYNQRRFNIVSQPLITIAGEYYIEENWLQRLFLVKVQKTNDAIKIIATSTTQQ
ncbi:RNA polymerase II [Ureibacillus composti]|nr:RNA polymerase II [Ureibacillus composti]